MEGARIASHIMFQEESSAGPGADLGNLACWRYCHQALDTGSWYYESEIPVDESPDEVIRVRVKGMIPNNYNDQHFDLREPRKILGKTLIYLNTGHHHLSTSLRCLGLVLSGQDDKLKDLGSFTINEEVLNIVKDISTNEETKSYLNSLETESCNVDDVLLRKCKESLSECEKDIIDQQKLLYKQWNKTRDELLGEKTIFVSQIKIFSLESEYQALMKRGRMEAIQQTKENLAKEEEKLFFFENFDKLEMEKDVKEKEWRRTFPNRSWNLPGYFRKARFVKKPGEERKVSRVERRELKRGPPK